MLALLEEKYKDLKKFETLEEAREFYYGRLGRYDKEFCKIGDELILMCCTVNAYDDQIENLIEKLFVKVLCDELGFAWNTSFDFELIDFVKPVAIEMIENLEYFADFKTEYLYTEF